MSTFFKQTLMKHYLGINKIRDNYICLTKLIETYRKASKQLLFKTKTEKSATPHPGETVFFRKTSRFSNSLFPSHYAKMKAVGDHIA